MFQRFSDILYNKYLSHVFKFILFKIDKVNHKKDMYSLANFFKINILVTTIHIKIELYFDPRNRFHGPHSHYSPLPLAAVVTVLTFIVIPPSFYF